MKLATITLVLLLLKISPAAAWSPEPTYETTPDGQIITVPAPPPTYEEYQAWLNEWTRSGRHDSGARRREEEANPAPRDSNNDNNYYESDESTSGSTRRKAKKTKRAQAPEPKIWTCLAQDGRYSYERYDYNKALAKKSARQACSRESDFPADCYDHRCF